MIRHRLAICAGAGLLVLALGSGAHAALTTDQIRCIDSYNNKLRQVGQQASKDYRQCIRSAGTGTAGADNCVVSDGPGNIAAQVAKVAALYPTTCDGTAPIQQGPSIGSNALVDAAQETFHRVFGHPILDATVVSPGSEIARCQDKAAYRISRLFTESLKAFRKCKKTGMRLGVISSASELQSACMSDPQPIAIPDPSGKQTSKVAKLIDDMSTYCASAPIGTTFPGQCADSATAAELGQCVADIVQCQVCQALNVADGTSADCDLFDDGDNNGSCGIALHTCVLDTSNCSPATNPLCGSKIELHVSALPIPLTFAISGSLDVGTGGVAGDVAACNIQNVNPINVPCIGTLCLTPSPGCSTGERWCGPGAGPPLGVDLQSDGVAGGCGSNAQCASIAAGPGGCAAFGSGYAVHAAACTGFCSGDAPANQACTTDANCLPSNGACNGPDPVGGNANICQISCIKTDAHGASDPGDLQCNLGANLVIELATPCNGTDAIVNIGHTCLPLSTQRASSVITDANFGFGTVPPPPNVNDQQGLPLACGTLDTSVTTGLRSRGVTNFFGTNFGDVAVGIQTTCQ